MDIRAKMESDPIFHHPNVAYTTEQAREATVKKMYKLRGWDVLPQDKMMEDLRKVCIFVIIEIKK